MVRLGVIDRSELVHCPPIRSSSFLCRFEWPRIYDAMLRFRVDEAVTAASEFH